MMRVKICGLTNPEDAMAAAEFGADAVGFVLYRDSPRYIKPGDVREIIAGLPPFVTTVGVFADAGEEEITSIVDRCGLDIIQLQGDETPELCRRLGPRVYKAIRVRDEGSLVRMASFSVSAFVLDTFRKDQLGGTGHTFDWNLALKAKDYGSVILAGGLNPDNIRKAVVTVRPAGVDVSSGVEATLGKKDPKKIKAFIETA
ncbi:MAG TPA: phosphoribosylanthranilate isomerase, partial [Nitrospiria bacterium]